MANTLDSESSDPSSEALDFWDNFLVSLMGILERQKNYWTTIIDHDPSIGKIQGIKSGYNFCFSGNLTQVVQEAENPMHRINHYPVDSEVWFANIYR